MTQRQTTARFISICALAAAAALSGCASVQNAPVTVASAVAQNADLATFYKLAEQAGLNDVLSGASPVTVFAPTNEAFQSVPAATLDKLAKDPAQLKALLSYHMIPGNVLAADIKENTTLTTLSGVKLGVFKAGDFVTVDDGMVSQADIKTSNGIIHKIDRVLTPPAVKK